MEFLPVVMKNKYLLSVLQNHFCVTFSEYAMCVIAVANGANKVFLSTKWKTYGQLRSSQLYTTIGRGTVKLGAKFQN